MFNIKILNSKETKLIMEIVERQWGPKVRLEYAFLINAKGKIYVVNKDIGRIELSELRINSVGLYFGELKDETVRLSIEGSQIVGPVATRNVVEFEKNEMKSWLRGNDVEKDCDASGFVILKHNGDFLGCGRYTNGVIRNFVPKTRRIKAAD